MEKLIRKVVKELNKNSIDYIIIGGHAVLIYGEPRFTKDIDITLSVDLSHIEKIKAIINKLKLKAIPKNVDVFTKKTMVLPTIDTKTGFGIDFIFSNSYYEKTAIKRANIKKIDGLKVNFASLEDLIIHKIISGREKDIEDIKTILLKNKKYNRRYILKWLKKIDNILLTDYLSTFHNITTSI